MKITRRGFKFIEDNVHIGWRLLKVKEDKYIYIYSFKRMIQAVGEFICKLLKLPFGLVFAIIEAIWECILELPGYFKELWNITLDLFPIKIIKVVDDEEIESIK